MKINIGDYVRTKKGTIYKFNSKSNMAKNGAKKYMVKSSPNIIGLVDVGDYVNGELVTSAEDVYTSDNIYIGKEVFVNHDELIIEEDIETIVTKEQFKSMEYKVGDKENE